MPIQQLGTAESNAEAFAVTFDRTKLPACSRMVPAALTPPTASFNAPEKLPDSKAPVAFHAPSFTSWIAVRTPLTRATDVVRPF